MKSLLLLDLTGRVFLKKEKIFYWLVSAFYISLFLPDMPVINNILIGAALIHSLYYNTVQEKLLLLKERKEIWLMFLFYVWLAVSALLSANQQEGMVLLVRRLPLLVFPVCIGSLYIREELKDRILLSYCFFTTVAAAACMIYALFQYSRTGNAGDLYDDNLTEAIGRPSVYVAMAVNLSLFTYVYLLQKQSFAIQYKGLVFLSIAFLVVFHYMLASRTSILTLYAGFVAFTIWHYGRSRQFVRGAMLIAVLVAGTFWMLQAFPRTANRFKELKNANYYSRAGEARDSAQRNSDQLNGTNVRFSVWNCGWELFRRHPVTGVPLGDKEDKLIEIFKERQFTYAIQTRLNMHNTYLDVLCNLGIFGLLAFVLGYCLLPLLASSRAHDGLGLFIILAFTTAMSTETWLDRSIGCIMAGFFLSLVSAWKRDLRYSNPVP
ncbi:MAG: O-antigen ligase family protein [Chitinophagaceae bacterium]|nr:O-antigen ligase family protein [Chitinophagaceae bacterium]